MDPFNHQQKPKRINRPTNFIEALKDVGSSIKTQTRDATVGTIGSAVDQFFGASKLSQAPKTGNLSPDKPFNFEDFLKSRERQVEQTQKQHYERQLRQEKLVFHRSEEEGKLQIKAIQEELKKLAQATSGLSQEVEKAVFEGVVEAGVYHLSFFAQIRKIIELARKQITESKTWFQFLNHRKKQKSHYWHQVKKSGTKFMLSHDRVVATQAG